MYRYLAVLKLVTLSSYIKKKIKVKHSFIDISSTALPQNAKTKTGILRKSFARNINKQVFCFNFFNLPG